MVACPCGSTSSLAECCLPFIQGKKKPKTAEELLRARYTAFTQGEIDFILATHHSKTRADVDQGSIQAWSKESEWLGLKVFEKEAGGPQDEQGTLIFCATYRNNEGLQEHWEQSLFEKENGEWRFLDARAAKSEPIKRTEPKTGRNDPCPCGSGKKFKKCCG